MKRYTVLLWLCVSALLISLPVLWMQLEPPVQGQTTNPVTLQWISPTNGQVVSGVIPLTVNAASSAAPITRIMFYRDGQLIAVISPNPQSPTFASLTVRSP